MGGYKGEEMMDTSNDIDPNDPEDLIDESNEQWSEALKKD